MPPRLKPSILLMLLGPVVAAASPPTPAPLAAYIHDGRFDPGDYGWLRGMFDGASAADVSAYRSIVDWRRRCRASDMAETRADLVALGVTAGSSLDTIPYRSLLCDQVATLPEPLDLHNWTGFSHDVSVVRPIAASYLAAVAAAEDAAGSDTPNLQDALRGRVIGEQTLRSGIESASGPAAISSFALDLTAQQRGILAAELAIALATRDHANTAWLKGLVAARGWPKRSEVGEAAAKSAWLLVQHADADPAFQVQALRAMKPLVAAGDADRRKYAYLYDRVMLKLTGLQHYATQLTCQSGRYVPLPTEAMSKVDEERKQVGLESLIDYQVRILKSNGACK